MKKRDFFITVTFAILLGIFILSGAFGVSESKNVEQEVYDKLANEEKVKIFIEIENTNQGASKGLSSSSLEEKEEILDIIGEENLRHDHGEIISAEVSLEELEELEGRGLGNVGLVQHRELALSTSVPLINGTNTSNLVYSGLNITGEGQTVCVIDSGIDLNHSDLGGCYGNNSIGSGCKIWGGWDYCSDDVTCTTNDPDPNDVHGHGTHVSGIAAANGSILGVARDARIVMVKACNSSGSCADDDVKAGLNWCVNNASTYNISVISMSLGGGFYDSSCDGVADPFDITGGINSAVAQNISVVVSTGNDANTTHIGSPACVTNATPVSSTTKSDAVSSFANRNSLVHLMAPGSSITSTYLNNGSAVLSGTSMSVPHVSGSILLLRQYLNQTARTRTPVGIESILNTSGKTIPDSGSGLDYSRVNIYDAILSLDNTNPGVNLSNPANGTNSFDTSHNFSCNATDLVLKNITFSLWSNGSLINETEQEIDMHNADFNSFSVNVSNLSLGSYEWNCEYRDRNNNLGLLSSNFSLTLSEIAVNLLSPGNGLFTNSNQSYTCNSSLSGTELRNSTLQIWNSSGSLISANTSNITGTSNGSILSYDFLEEGSYEWNCLVEDNETNQQLSSANYSVTYDITNPNLTVTSPTKPWMDAGRFNLTLDANSSCSYSLDLGVNNVTMNNTGGTSFFHTNTTLVQDQEYNVSYYCTDNAGNRNYTETATFSADLTNPSVTQNAPSSGHSVTGSQEIVFEYNVTDNLNVSSCSVVYDDEIKGTNSSVINPGEINNITFTVGTGEYNWRVNCTDEAGNIGSSSSRLLTISSTGSGDDGGGSSGGGGDNSGSTGATYRPTDDQVTNGYTRELREDDKVKFDVYTGISSSGSREEHTLTIRDVKTSSANIRVESDPIDFTLVTGQNKKLELTDDNYYDLNVKLENVVGGKANLTIQEISEEIIEVINSTSQGNETTTGDEESQGSRKTTIVWILIVLLLLVISGISWWFLKNKDKGKSKDKKEN